MIETQNDPAVGCPLERRVMPILLHGDNVTELRKMSDCCIGLTVTSPPYDNLRTYNGFSWDFEALAKELFRVTKEGGVVVWNVNDATVKGSETGTSFRQALFFMSCGFNLHDTMIWCKSNPVPTQHTRYQNAFEYMFVFSKGKPKATNILREPSKSAGGKRKKHRAVGGAHDDNSDGEYVYQDTKTRNNYWVIAVSCSKETGAHSAAFPEQLASDHILSWSNEGDTVLDPFMGSGTTGKMALLNNRKFVGIELSEEYFEIARNRIMGHNAEFRPTHAASSREVAPGTQG